MSRERGPVFLARQAYFRRRLMDAARLLPVLGAGLFVLPLLWKSPAEDEGARTVLVMLYIFLCWIALTGLAWLVSRRLTGSEPPVAMREGPSGAAERADRTP